MNRQSNKIEVPVRIRVLDPAAGIMMKVQRGRDELLSPEKESKNELVFEFAITVDMSAAVLNFLGKYAQGPKDQRFIYVNSGQSAGQLNTDIVRRAKISLMSIAKQQVAEAALDGHVLETSFPGKDKFGKPTCASVKGIEWKVASR